METDLTTLPQRSQTEERLARSSPGALPYFDEKEERPSDDSTRPPCGIFRCRVLNPPGPDDSAEPGEVLLESSSNVEPEDHRPLKRRQARTAFWVIEADTASYEQHHGAL